MKNLKIAILGAGNIGSALAEGLRRSGKFRNSEIILTKRTIRESDKANKNFKWTSDNKAAVKASSVIVLGILPQQLDKLISEIKPSLDPNKHLIISVVSGVSCADIVKACGKKMQVVRAMPNTAISIGSSMTCIASSEATDEKTALVKEIFDTVGETIEINEELMTSATALNACGIAFFLRAIRAASQGGVEIGFHAEEALRMAAQTAAGAARLLLERHSHPEREIDKVTSPKGCTIAGLNEMEHQGFSSAMIRGIKLSAEKAGGLYTDEK